MEGIEDNIGDAVKDYLEENDINVDLTGYATEKYVDDAIAVIELTPGPAGPTGAPGPKGEDGYTPVKGVDYFDGAPGEPGKDGAPGKDGKDGYTPVKGVDYFDGRDGADGAPGADGQDYVLTEEDKQEIAGMVEVSGGGEVSVDNETIIKDDNGAIQTSAYIKGGAGQYSSVIGVGVGTDGSATNEGATAISGGSASGASSVAIGTRSSATKQHSFAMGYYASATGQKQTVIGTHNITDTTSSFILGSGTGSSAKRNAMTVDANNQVHFPGTVVVGEDKSELATKAYVDEVAGAGGGSGGGGEDYVLTDADKQEIAGLVVASLPVYNGEVI